MGASSRETIRAAIASHIDLDEVPFTAPGSRLLIRADDQGLSIHEARYEVPLEESTLLRGLTVRDATGRPQAWHIPDPARITWGQDGPTLAISPQGQVIIGHLPAHWTVSWIPGPLAPTMEMEGAIRLPNRRTVVRTCLPQASVRLHPSGSTGVAHSLDEDVTASLRRFDEWMERCPRVLPEHQDMTWLCWWVLGVNTVHLEGRGRVVVPSKIGYVGLWQWDAYFIAIGLRHGDVDLAAEQLRIALGHQLPNGQLPDVVHEAGVLTSSGDLPESDQETLRALGTSTDHLGPVPLTKPPLAAPAVEAVAQAHPGDLVSELSPAIRRCQEWWFSHCDPQGGGVPCYLHPYSSGLDDSPVFAAGTPLESPDLTAYLSVQDTILARWARERGHTAAADRHEARSRALRDRLARQLDPATGFVPATGPAGPCAHLTIVSLMPLLVPGLDPVLRTSLFSLLDSARAFGIRTPVPTVARTDPAFDAERMWRGPVWVNTNWLVAHGLRTQGRAARAEALESATLKLVIEAGGPAEYFDPLTRRRPPGATTCFAWSAALFVDMAVSAAVSARRRSA